MCLITQQTEKSSVDINHTFSAGRFPSQNRSNYISKTAIGFFPDDINTLFSPSPLSESSFCYTPGVNNIFSLVVGVLRRTRRGSANS